MGYESKVFIVVRHELKQKIDGTPLENPHVYAEVVAEYDLCKMGWGAQEFYNAFKKKIDYTLQLPVWDNASEAEIMSEQDKDCYGSHMKSAELGELVAALKTCEERDPYRRLPPLIALLESLINHMSDWQNDHEELQAVHYGY